MKEKFMQFVKNERILVSKSRKNESKKKNSKQNFFKFDFIFLVHQDDTT